MSLMDNVKESIYIHGMNSEHEITKPNVMLANVWFGGKSKLGIIGLDEQRSILDVFFSYGPNIRPSRIKEVQIFTEEFNALYNPNLGCLNTLWDGEVDYSYCFRIDILADARASIGPLVREIGRAAERAFQYVGRIECKQSSAKDELFKLSQFSHQDLITSIKDNK